MAGVLNHQLVCPFIFTVILWDKNTNLNSLKNHLQNLLEDMPMRTTIYKRETFQIVGLVEAIRIIGQLDRENLILYTISFGAKLDTRHA